MKIKQNLLFRFTLVLLFLCVYSTVEAGFTHPGGLVTQADLDRMKAKIAAKASPWYDGYQLMTADFKAKSTYIAKPDTTLGNVNSSSSTRQQAVKDADAAFFNTLEWYITGSTANRDCAVNILNAWSNKINSVVTGELFMLPMCHMVEAAELLRGAYPTWGNSSDFTRFKNMSLNYFYPAAHNFIGQCGSWPGWDGPAMAAILEIGVLCDDQAKFDEAVNYYKTGLGGGSLYHNVWLDNGQLSEIGRDLPHAAIGPSFISEMCLFAWNQGVDLFSLDNNRLLKGFEYFCKYNLNNSVDWTVINDSCNNGLSSNGLGYPNLKNFYYPSALNRNRIYHNSVYEIIYNHYVVTQGLSPIVDAPYTTAMLKLNGICSNSDDNLGYCALTYCQDNLTSTSVYTALSSKPSAPTGLTATPGVSNVYLKWTGPSGNVANGYIIQRCIQGGSYSTIASLTYNTSTEYIDTTGNEGTLYYYKVAAMNPAGTGLYSSYVTSTSIAGSVTLPTGWSAQDVGTVATTGGAMYGSNNNNTFILKGSGDDVGGTTDNHRFVYTPVDGDYTITARISSMVLNGSLKTKIGLMMLESIAPNAKKVAFHLSDSETRMPWLSARTTTGGTTLWASSGDSHTRTPVWFKLKRSGNVFTAYQSQDNVTWFTVGTTTASMQATYYVGMFVCGGSSTTGITATATFDNVAVGPILATGSEAPVQHPEISLYPNPVADELYIKTDNAQKLMINIFTISGTKVLSENTTGNSCPVNVKKLYPGIYIAKVNDGKSIFTSRFVKE